MKIQILSKINWPKDLAGAWLFYTILPLFQFIKPRFKNIVRFAPFIGVFIGGVQSLAWIALSHMGWGLLPSILISISIGIILTGGLHLDGLMDTVDGIGAGPIKCLEAMKDSRSGSLGVQALLLIILLQIAALTKLESFVPLAFPIATFWGRFSQIWAVGNFKYITQDRKLSFHKKYWEGNKKEMMPSLFLISFIVTAVFLSPNLLVESQILSMVGIICCIFPAILIPIIISNKIGGHNGDSYGASLVLVETISLLILSFCWSPIQI